MSHSWVCHVSLAMTIQICDHLCQQQPVNPPRTVSRLSSSIFGLTRTKFLGLLLEKLSDSPSAFRIITQKWNQSIESERDYELLGQELRRCGDRAWNAVTNLSTGNLSWNAITDSEEIIQRNICFSLFHLLTVFGISFFLRGETTAHWK